MNAVPAHVHEPTSNATRVGAASVEPRALRTYTPTQAVIARSAGVYHWTPEGRRLYDFTSGVLVANLGHNPISWMRRFTRYMGWPIEDRLSADDNVGPYFSAAPLTAYNAVTSLDVEASRRLVELLRSRRGGRRMEQALWAASGSEAVQKALWAALARDRSRDLIVATRFGFHGKKGLAGAVTGCETDRDRDPRVSFISFPMAECLDVSMRGRSLDLELYRRELDKLLQQSGRRLGVLITEPYLGGGGSYHPPATYLRLLEEFCRENELIFILDEVQSNFGRTGELFAFETYGIEPDLVVLGKGLANGIPVAATVGRADLLGALDFGEGSDTWSANPLGCAAVLATLDEFAASEILHQSRRVSAIVEKGLIGLKKVPFVANVRGEQGGMVWGVQTCDHGGHSAAEWANAFVLSCYKGVDGRGDGVHLLGPLAKKVVRIAPPLVLTEPEARDALDLMQRALAALASPMGITA
jgi:4-aminobutyrate aminotransferase-like enzyme